MRDVKKMRWANYVVAAGCGAVAIGTILGWVEVSTVNQALAQITIGVLLFLAGLKAKPVEKTRQSVGETEVLAQWHASISDTVEKMSAYRSQLESAGFSPTMAEQMTGQFHHALMARSASQED